MFCDLCMYKKNWKVYFLDLCKGINKLISTLLVHWNVWKYSDHVVAGAALSTFYVLMAIVLPVTRSV